MNAGWGAGRTNGERLRGGRDQMEVEVLGGGGV